jgi:hypothetical protein
MNSIQIKLGFNPVEFMRVNRMRFIKQNVTPKVAPAAKFDRKEWYRRKAAKNRASGLRADGKPRTYRRTNIPRTDRKTYMKTYMSRYRSRKQRAPLPTFTEVRATTLQIARAHAIPATH